MMSPALGRTLIAAAVLWHVFAVVANGWTTASKDKHGRDFASYYYAVQVARAGGDPYDTRALEKEARGLRKKVHPYFYPPPFLLTMGWIGADMGLIEAYKIWFWLDELYLLAALLALGWWWRPLRGALPWVLVSAAVLTAIPNNHVMGQANLPVLCLALWGLALADPLSGRASRGRELVGGALMGAACMLKMSPALFVVWWLFRRRWWPAAASVGAAVVLSVAALGMVSPAVQWHFYSEVLPGFGSGSYNGLTVDIGLYGNHSIPNLLDMAFPDPGNALSSTARLASLVATGLVLGAMGWAFRRGGSGLSLAAQASAIGVAMLLIPVYTYEHHIVWAIPAAALALHAVTSGALRPAWAPVVGIAVTAWAFELAALKKVARSMDPSVVHEAVIAGAVQESKFFALALLWLAAVAVGWGGSGARGDTGG